MIQFRRPALLASAAVITGIATFAMAQMDEPTVSGAGATHIAILSGDNEVPPVTTNGNGTAFLVLDVQTNTLTWTIEFADLTGPVTGVHIHGPATAEENADVIIDLGAEDLESPIEGQTTLTMGEAQIDQLTAGEWYVNVHTEANPDGEIRGQVEANPG